MNNIHRTISYPTVDTLNICYKDKAGNTIEENNSWLLWGPYETTHMRKT